MFKNILSSNGRIRRTEYCFSFIAFIICKLTTQIIAFSHYGGDEGSAEVLSYILLIPFFVIFWLQGIKRCHDLGHNGWWQLIPLYILALILDDGDKGENKYGASPKGH